MHKQEYKTETRRICSKNNVRLSHGRVRQQIGLRTFVERNRHKCADCAHQYSESVPLLQEDGETTRRCSSFFVRATQSAVYITF